MHKGNIVEITKRNSTETDIPKMLTLFDAAAITGISYESLRRMCIRGELVHVRVGRKYFLNADKLAEYLNGNGQVK